MVEIIIIIIIIFFIINKLDKNFKQMMFQMLIILMFLNYILFHSFSNKFMWSSIYYIMGVDLYSHGLILLSGWILVLMLMVSMNFFLNSSNNFIYMMLMNFLLLILFICFISMNLMMFYIFFEISLIPIFFLIMGWGYQVDRIQAGIYMMLYTLFGSMPLFMMIIYLYIMNNSIMMNVLLIKQFNFFIYFIMIFAFLIKLPMYFVHLWLPKAHVEAPVMGSMILAGVMLKLGSYGLLRSMLMMVELSMKFNKIFIVISLMGGLYSSLICMCQIDMKMLVAYSSVVHMSVMMSGLMTMFSSGFIGGYLMMLAHGLCSSGMFCLVNINYERLLSRSIYFNKGLINYFPSLSLMWFLLCSSNLSFPPSLNLWSEILLINSLIMWNKKLIFLLMLILFFSASYTLYLYSYTQHGKMNLMNYMMKSVKVMDYLVLLLHWIPLNIVYIFIHIYL